MQALIATFLSIAVLITGVVLLSLKSSAKTATDPYTVTTESNSIHLRPRQPRQRSAGAEAYGDAENGEAAPRGGKKGDVDGAEGEGTQGERGERGEEVMWEVGSLSDSDDDEGKKPLGPNGASPGRRADDGEQGEVEDGVADEEARRRGVGQPGARGERRGLLGDGDDAEEEEPGASRRI
jgi:hypothetical protein